MATRCFLTTRHLVGQVVCPVAQSHLVKVFHRNGVALATAHTLIEEGQGDVLQRILVESFQLNHHNLNTIGFLWELLFNDSL